MLPDTRWVKLSELTDNIREADLKALDEFTRGLNKAIKDARRRSHSFSSPAGLALAARTTTALLNLVGNSGVHLSSSTCHSE